jgi:uncharacterized protein (DUF952 family)
LIELARETAPMTVYKIISATLWEAAEQEGVFRGAGVDLADGFIHLSSAAQAPETAARHFAGQRDLLLIAIDSARLWPALKWERSRGGDLFPHLYGALPRSAVLRVDRLPIRADGRHDFSGLL